jgi:hypothetical protein
MHEARTTKLATFLVSHFESNFVENLLHRDLSTDYIKVNTWHDHLLAGSGVPCSHGTEKRHRYFRAITPRIVFHARRR